MNWRAVASDDLHERHERVRHCEQRRAARSHHAGAGATRRYYAPGAETHSTSAA